MIREGAEGTGPGPFYLVRSRRKGEEERAVAKEGKEESTKERTRGGTCCQSLSGSVRLCSTTWVLANFQPAPCSTAPPFLLLDHAGNSARARPRRPSYRELSTRRLPPLRTIVVVVIGDRSGVLWIVEFKYAT